jgi:Sec-independent protein translocase protein TatA
MNNFEQIDDYLAGRLKGKDREDFESQIGHDPSLKSEVDLQRQIIEGIKQARGAELKAMLSRVPVGGAGAQIEFTVMRIAAGILLAGVVSAAAYYYFSPGDFPPIGNAAADVTRSDKKLPEDKNQASETKEPEAEQKDETRPQDDHKDEVKKPATQQEQPTPAQKPDLDLVDPSVDLDNDERKDEERPVIDGKPEIRPSQVQVEMDSSNKKYDFHYQFAGSKLMLYGSFNRSLYEVLEINSGSHSLFLYYKNEFYLLDESQDDITKLTAIKDPVLLKKLREYRSR